MHQKTTDHLGYWRLPAVLKFLGNIGKTTFEEEVKAGRYPEPFKLSKRINGWRIKDIIAGVEGTTKE